MTAYVGTQNLSAYIGVLRKETPQLMASVRRGSLLRIGKETIRELRSTGLTRFRSKKLGNTFKRQLIDQEQTLSIYSKWDGAGIHETGGTIIGRGKMLLVWLPGGLKANGARKYSDAQIASFREAGRLISIPRPGKPTLIVLTSGRTTKSGGLSNGSKWTPIAVLKRSVRIPSRYSLVGAHNRAAPAHEKVALKTLNEVIDTSKLVDRGA